MDYDGSVRFGGSVPERLQSPVGRGELADRTVQLYDAQLEFEECAFHES